MNQLIADLCHFGYLATRWLYRIGLNAIPSFFLMKSWEFSGEDHPDHVCAEHTDNFSYGKNRWISRCRICGHTVEVREYFWPEKKECKEDKDSEQTKA